mgnify:CR=1 FL=1
MTIGYIASAKTGNGLSRLMLKSNMPETWDCSPSVQGGITENGINGKQYIARIHPEIFVEKDKSDNDTETELYALEY